MPRTPPTLALFPLIVALATVGCGDDPAAPETVKADDGSTGAGGAVDPGQSTEKDYPAGPYGFQVGQTIQNLTFQGLRSPKASNYQTNTTERVSFADYYNPTRDPSKPVALVVTGAARWCAPCKDEASKSMGFWKYWNPKGVEFFSAVIEDENYEPSTFTDLSAWASTYKLEYPVTIDPSPPQLGAYFKADAIPFNMVIDTTTMTIVYKIEGSVMFDQNNPTLKKLIPAQ